MLRADGHAVPGFTRRIDSEVPLGAGLSSSAALECAIAVGVAGPARPRPRRGHAADGWPTPASGPRTTTSGRRPVAWTRRWRCSVGRASRSSSTSPTAVSRRVALPLDDAGLALLVIDTRVSHSLTDGLVRRPALPSARRPPSALGVGSLRDTDLASVERMDDPVLRRRARHVVTENQRVLDAVAALDAGDWTSLSATLDASHVSMRDDFEISCRGARPRGGDGPRRRSAGCPDDGRRLRRVRRRAGAPPGARRDPRMP